MLGLSFGVGKWRGNQRRTERENAVRIDPRHFSRSDPLSRRIAARGCPAAVGATDRHARRIVSALTDRGVLTADSARGLLRLVFPATLASRWMPGLFPERVAPAAGRGRELTFPAPGDNYVFNRKSSSSGARTEKRAFGARSEKRLSTTTSAEREKTS
jgi:hypothetical protein